MNDSLDCLQAYKEYLIEREMSENTIEKYLRDVRAFVRYMGGRELERAEVLRYKKELLAQYKITSANVSYRITCNNGNQRTLINP